MAITVTDLYVGVDARMSELAFEAADTTYDWEHGLEGPVFPWLVMNDAAAYDVRVSIDAFGANLLRVDKDAGTACTVICIVINKGALRVG